MGAPAVEQTGKDGSLSHWQFLRELECAEPRSMQQWQSKGPRPVVLSLVIQRTHCKVEKW